MPLPRIEITGTVTAVSLRVTGRGKPVCNFTVTTCRLRKDHDKWRETDHTQVRCVAWDRLAETVSDATTEGIEVTVIGEMKAQSWTQDGEARADYEVTAKQVALTLPLRAERTTTPDPDDPWAKADETAPF